MSVYSDSEILDELQTGHIVINPFTSNNLRGSSYDITLGKWFYTTDRLGTYQFYNPFDQDDVNRYFVGPLEAIRHDVWCEKYNRKLFTGITPDHLIIVLQPGERILAHSQEFIGILPPGTTEMRARSTLGRNGVVACKDAGWGDPGYINRWTLEIQNDNREATILPVGYRVAQIIFHRTGPVQDTYSSQGKYQMGTEWRDVVKNWSPKQMLPKAYVDTLSSPYWLGGIT